MDCVHHIDTFVIMFKLALKPSAIFIVFFAFVFVCFGLTVYLLLGDALQSFSSLPNCLIVSAGVLTGEYPFLDDAESMDGQDQLLLLMWFWIFMIVTVFIMLNVFITIIGEAYEKAKEIDLAQSTLSYHWLSFLCFPLMIFRMKYVIAAINELMTSGEVQIGTGGCKKKSPQKYDNVISVQMPSGQVDGEWQGGTTLHSDMLRLVDDKFGCMVGQSWIKSALRWGMVEPEEMDEDEEDLSGVAKVHAKIFENYTLHVGNIDLTEASEVALNALFSRFGHVVQVTVRVRKEPELSWALITMLTEANVAGITNLKIEAGGKILKTRLVEMHKAKASTG